MDICASELTSKAVSFFKCFDSHTRGRFSDTLLKFTQFYFAGSGLKSEYFLPKAISIFCYEKEKNFAPLSSSP